MIEFHLPRVSRGTRCTTGSFGGEHFVFIEGWNEQGVHEKQRLEVGPFSTEAEAKMVERHYEDLMVMTVECMQKQMRKAIGDLLCIDLQKAENPFWRKS